MAGKTLIEIFQKHSFTAPQVAWLKEATDIGLRADKERRMIEVSAFFPVPKPKRELYKIEEEIARTYDLSMVRILPRYPASFFDKEYMSGVIVKYIFTVTRNK